MIGKLSRLVVDITVVRGLAAQVVVASKPPACVPKIENRLEWEHLELNARVEHTPCNLVVVAR